MRCELKITKRFLFVLRLIISSPFFENIEIKVER